MGPEDKAQANVGRLMGVVLAVVVLIMAAISFASILLKIFDVAEWFA